VPGYEILREMGRGGMGVVYKALQVGLKRPVALKMILAGEFAGAQTRARFQAEAEAVARLRHPHIVQIHDIGEHQGRSYFSLEFCEGGSLDRRLAGTPQPPRLAAQLVEALAGAMDAAHRAGVVHRDLKPANVLLVGGPDTPLEQCVPKVTDFGLAKTLDSEAAQTRTGSVMGTPPYMAPEQAEGRTHDVGAWTDVYALGAILYELLTGRPPFRAATAHETLHQVCTREPVPPRQLAPACPRDLETICLACLRKAHRRRYVTGRGLAEDLRRFLAGEPIQARRAGRLERAVKWARRRPTAALLAVTGVLALLAAFTAAVSFGLYKDQEAKRTDQEARRKALELDGLREQFKRRQRIDALWDRGKEAEAARNYKEAADHYGRALAILGPGGDTPDELFKQIEGRLAGVQRRLQERTERDQVRDRLKQFDDKVDEVRFRDVSPTARDQLANREQVRRLAPAALALVQFPANGPPEGAGRALEPLRRYAEPGELERVAAACYEVLLIWAEAEAAPLPADPPAEPAARAGRALDLLDTAAALGKEYGLRPSQAFHLRRSRYLAQRGDEPGARQERGRADATPPTTAFDHFLAALEEYQRGQPGKAAAHCQDVLALQPDHYWARYLQALCYLQAKQWELAKIGLTACLARPRPGFPWARLLRAVAHAELQEFKEAKADYGLALREAGDDGLNRYLVLINRSVFHARQRHWDDAVADLKEAHRLRPEGAQAWTTLGWVDSERKHWDDAAAALTRALELQPENGQLWYIRAQVHQQRKDWVAARRDLEQAVAPARAVGKPAWLADAWVQLGHLRHKAGEHEAALAACAAAEKVVPGYAPAQLQRADTLRAMGNYAEAGRALDRYLRKGEPSAEVYKVRGLIHDKLREHPQAVEAYGRAIAFGKDAAVLSYRGWAYLRLKAVGPALADFQAALRLDPARAEALCGRGHARVAQGQIAEAAADAEAAASQARAAQGQIAEAAADAEAAASQARSTAALLLNAACIYGQAAGQEQAQRTPARWRQAAAARYGERAVQLVRAALEELPPGERAGFWRDSVLPEPALAPVRLLPAMWQLERKYAR
jgi:tetratricopeptide (TPR) repeat protein